MSDVSNDYEDLSALIDGELTPAREAELRGRLEADPELARRFAELVSINEELRTLPAAVIPQQLRTELRQRIDAERIPPRRSRAPWTFAAAALAASLAVYFFVSNGEVASEFDGATDEEIGIALDYDTLDTLADLELIEELEVLELMAERG